MKVGSLFSGIGGLDLGLERAGMRVVWQSEIDPFASAVLAARWPGVPNLGDVNSIDWSQIERPDVIAGGVPCQPFSSAGLRRGTDDPRHLWPAMFRAIRVLRPRYALVENVAGFVTSGLPTVLADLASIGFDAEWSLVSACSVGAPHTRRRLFIVAHSTTNDGTNQGRAATTLERPRRQLGRSRTAQRPTWLSEPALDRVAHGIPSRVVRPQLEALGNAVVPQVAEFVGRRIIGGDLSG